MKQGVGTSPVQEGELVAGRYRVDRVIGVGGMGVVVSAKDERLDVHVAIKFLMRHALEHPEIVARFSREARAAVRIKNEHVARVMDVGTLDDGVPFMVMEYLEGHDLASELARNGPLAVDDVVDYVLQASEALQEAHDLGFVHRDLKPANLFLVRRPGASLVKVLDFGISKLGSVLGDLTGSGAAMTQTTSLLGSPLYMSPEQMDSARAVDARTDVWALGVIMYELLNGKPPFTGESVPQLCMAIVQRQPFSLRTTRSDVSPQLESVVLRCLEKDREQRFRSVAELANALADFAPPRSHLSLERISARASRASSDSEIGNLTVTSIAPSPLHDSSRARGLNVGGARGGRREVANVASGGSGTASDQAQGSTQTGFGGTSAGRRTSRALWGIVALSSIAVAAVAAVVIRSHPTEHAAAAAASNPASPAPTQSTETEPPRREQIPPVNAEGAPSERPSAPAPSVPEPSISPIASSSTPMPRPRQSQHPSTVGTSTPAKHARTQSKPVHAETWEVDR